MIFSRQNRMVGQGIAALALASVLTACAPVDDSIGSQLSQPPPGAEPMKVVDAGDIAIASQQFAHAVLDVPEVANATVPAMVQFTGVTSIVDKPVDTDPYTEFLRDRLILLTHEKLRFVERTLPPLVKSKKDKGKQALPVETSSEAQYQVLAELRGHFEDDTYKIQMEFIDLKSGQALYNALYRIHKEEAPAPPVPQSAEAPPATGAPQ